MRTSAVFQAILCSSILVGSAIGQTKCPPLGDTERAKLIDYVQKRYKTPATTRLEITGVEFVGATCYRKLQFKAQDPRSTFRLDLFAAPDLRFLARDLLDSTIDPVMEERQRVEALAVGLTRGDLPTRGKSDAPVTIAVFSDFQCPYCSAFAATMKQLSSSDADKVRLVFHHFPLPMHPWARSAAEAAACAQQQGNTFFWALHDFMFEHQKEIAADNLQSKLAQFTKGLTGFDQGKFATCLAERSTATQIDRELAFAQGNGVTGTPTTFVNGQKLQIVSPEQIHTIVRQLDETPTAQPADSGAVNRQGR